MVKGDGEDKSLPSSVNKGRSNLGENSRRNFVENSILEELNRSGNFQSKGVLDSQLELLLLLQNQKQQQSQQKGKDKDSNLSRGGNAPPIVEGASSATEGLIRNPSFGFVDYNTSVSDGETIDAESRSHPAYLAYYYSNINNNPRLPPPLLSLEEWRIFQRLQEAGSSTGEYGNWRSKEFVQEGSGSSSLFQMQRGIPSHKAEDDLIEMRKTAARNLSRISSSESMETGSVFAGPGKSGMGERRKSFADILQGEPGKSSTPPSRLSRPASYNSLTDMINHSSSTSELEKRSASSEALHSGQVSPSKSSHSAFPKFFTAEAGPSLTKIKTSEPYRNLKSPPGFPNRTNRASVDRKDNNVSSDSLSPSHKKTETSDIQTSFSGLNGSKGQGNAGSPSESTLPLGFSNGHEQTLHQQFKYGGNKFSSLADYMNFMIENEVLLDKNFVHSNYERQMDYPKRASSMINLQSLANSSEYSIPGDSKLGRQDDTPKRVSSMVDLDLLANSLESIKMADQNIQGMTDAILKEQSLRRGGILGPSNLHSAYDQQNHYLDKSDDCGRSSATVPPNLSRARNVLSTSYSADDLHELGKIYKEALLSQQKQQDQLPFLYKPGHMNSQYHGNTSSGSYTYQGSPRAYSARSFAKSGGRLQKEGASRFSNSFKNKGLSFGSRKSEGKTTVEGKFGSGSQQELKNSKHKTLELTEVLNDVVKFSKDQHGSRFIQQRLETANVEEKMKIFSQIAPHARELMTDVFGNYVIQKFFENGTENQRKELANQIIGHVLPLSLQMYGCRVIQKALEVIDVEQQTLMVKELDGSVLKCIHDQNGNHVIQKCIECIPQDRIQFIISSFFGQIVALSTHPYGCRVIQRILERCDDPHAEQTIMDEIMASVCTLAEDQYGNYVIQHVLEHGKPHERSAIIAKLTGQIVKMSQHKFASNVVEKCLIFSTPEEHKLIVTEMLGSTEENEVLQAMMKDPFGNYVVQKVLETCDDQDREWILSRVRVHLSTLKKYTYGKHIVSRVEKLIEAGERQTEISAKNTSKDAS